MPTIISDSTFQALIVTELQADSTELVVPPTLNQVKSFWALYENKRAVDPDRIQVGSHLQYLYTKRHGVQFMQEQAWQDVNTTTAGVQQDTGNKFQALSALYESLTSEIAAAEKRATANRTAQVGQITTTAPNQPLTYPTLDPNDSFYRGDPIKPQPRGIW